MSEPIPAALVTTAILLLTAISFFTLLGLWTEHSARLNETAASQEQRLAMSLEIPQVALSEDVCPNYAGPFDASVVNRSTTSFTDFDLLDVFVDYVDDADRKVTARLPHGSAWSVSSIDPDNRDPNHWDPAETGTVSFTLEPKLSATVPGVFLIATPQGISNSRYFTCPEDCRGFTGLLSPTAEAADGGDGFEVFPQNAFADDGNAASSVETGGGGPNSDSHRYFNYGFAIHPACEIKGIEVRLDWWVLHTTGSNSMSVDLSWDGGTSWTAAKTDLTETTVEHTVVLGSDSDTWGRVWAPGELDDPDFRVRVSTSRTIPQTFFLDWVAVNVYFGLP